MSRSRVTWLGTRVPFKANQDWMATVASGEHPTRVALRRIEDGSPVGWEALAAQYDNQATSWRSWTDSQTSYDFVLQRALDYHKRYSSRSLELGCGTGEAMGALGCWVGEVVATDVSLRMLSQIPSTNRYAGIVACDSRSLPFPSGCFDLVFGLNPVVDIREAARVVGDRGWILLCYTFGDLTPVYIPPEKLIHDLPSRWEVVVSESEIGIWMAFLESAGAGAG